MLNQMKKNQTKQTNKQKQKDYSIVSTITTSNRKIVETKTM
jgi:hypothetical protein